MKILIDNDVVIASSEAIEFGFYEGENKYKVEVRDSFYYIGIPEDRCTILEVTNLPDDFVSYKYKCVNSKFVINENWVAPEPVVIGE